MEVDSKLNPETHLRIGRDSDIKRLTSSEEMNTHNGMSCMAKEAREKG